MDDQYNTKYYLNNLTNFVKSLQPSDVYFLVFKADGDKFKVSVNTCGFVYNNLLYVVPCKQLNALDYCYVYKKSDTMYTIDESGAPVAFEVGEPTTSITNGGGKNRVRRIPKGVTVLYV